MEGRENCRERRRLLAPAVPLLVLAPQRECNPVATLARQHLVHLLCQCVRTAVQYQAKGVTATREQHQLQGGAMGSMYANAATLLVLAPQRERDPVATLARRTARRLAC